MGGSWAGKCELCGQGAAAPRSQLASNPSFMSNAHAKVQLCLLCHNALPQRARAYPNTLVVGITMCFAPPHLCSWSLLPSSCTHVVHQHKSSPHCRAHDSPAPLHCSPLLSSVIPPYLLLLLHLERTGSAQSGSASKAHSNLQTALQRGRATLQKSMFGPVATASTAGQGMPFACRSPRLPLLSPRLGCCCPRLDYCSPRPDCCSLPSTPAPLP